MFYEQLKIACQNKSTTPTAIAREFDMSTGNVTKWKNGGFPSVELLVKLSKRLDVTIDYLLTGEETTDIKTNSANNVSTGDINNNSGIVGVGHNHAPVTITIKNGEEHTRELSKQELDLLDIYNDVDGYEQNEIMNFVYKYKK